MGASTTVGAISDSARQTPDRPAAVLPSLRPDLRLTPGPATRTGAPTWTIHDRARNRFYRIGELELVLMRYWAPLSPSELAKQITRRSGVALTENQVVGFARFLTQNQLVQASDAESYANLRTLWQKGRGRFVNRLFHRYLFFRLPLLAPQAFLKNTLPMVNWAFSWSFMAVMGGLALLAFVLLFQRWDTVLANVEELWRPATLLWFFALLALSKVVHEFAHGYALVRYGVQVHSFGIAFLVFWPVLFTESSEAWKITRRRSRLLISLAGIAAEICLAIVALLLWSMVDPGAFRNGLFMIAAFGLMTTLFINLNPFMRFDGYYLFSDLFDLPNLHSRAFQMSRWWIRRRLFGVDLAAPEQLDRRTRGALIVFGFATWAYRAFLFFIIALLVYSFFIKVVGIVLFALEIWLLILAPILSEVKALRTLRSRMRITRGGAAALVVLALLLFLFFFPFHSPITVPAIGIADKAATLYTEAPAKLAEVRARPDAQVQRGQLLFRFVSPDLEHRLKAATLEAAVLRARIRVLEASAGTIDAAEVVRVRLTEIERTRLGLRQQLAKLNIRAPWAGRLVDLAPDLQINRWYPTGFRLGVVITPERSRIVAYVPVTSVGRLNVDSSVRFYPDYGDGTGIKARVGRLEKTNLRQLEQEAVADIRGGRLPVQTIRGNDGRVRLVPAQPVYRVILRPVSGTLPADTKVTGTAKIDAGRQSFASRFWNWLAAVFIRESSF